VVGSWSIEIPCIQKNFGDFGQKATLSIYLSDDGTKRQIFAIFDFIIVTGIMRFIDPRLSQVSGTVNRRARKAKSEDDSEYDEDDEEANDEAEDSDEFYFDNSITPSSSNAVWNYRWRGQETGENLIELGSDKNICSIMFKGTGGITLEGNFKNDICCNDCSFTGRKISPTPSSSMPKPRREWGSRSEKEYDYACVARW
jgi:hypothetical protein